MTLAQLSVEYRSHAAILKTRIEELKQEYRLCRSKPERQALERRIRLLYLGVVLAGGRGAGAAAHRIRDTEHRLQPPSPPSAAAAGETEITLCRIPTNNPV